MRLINKDEWLIVKAQGKARYILFHWILPAAIPVAIIMPIIRGLLKGYSVNYFREGKFL